MVLRAYADSAPMVSCGPWREELDPSASETGRMGRCMRVQFAEAERIVFQYVAIHIRDSRFTDLASSRLTSGFASVLERAMEAMPKRRSALAMVRALLALAPQVCKSSELLRSILFTPK